MLLVQFEEDILSLFKRVECKTCAGEIYHQHMSNGVAADVDSNSVAIVGGGIRLTVAGPRSFSFDGDISQLDYCCRALGVSPTVVI